MPGRLGALTPREQIKKSREGKKGFSKTDGIRGEGKKRQWSEKGGWTPQGELRNGGGVKRPAVAWWESLYYGNHGD